jgi:hypothetical protein
MTRTAFFIGALLGLQGAGAWAADQVREKTVEFPKGKTGVVVSDSIKGYDSVKYKLSASAGQTMTVTLKTSNRSNYFNVAAASEPEALFIGSTSGNHFSGTLPKNGQYVVDVYLMRNAARRNEVAKYNIDFQITGSPKAAK